MQDEEKKEDHFLGVMGTDVPLDYLKEFMLQPLVSKVVPKDICYIYCFEI